MNLVRDLLDQQLVDKNGRNIGRVDGILLELRSGRPPRVMAIESGIVTLARRVHRRFERWLRSAAVRWSPVPLAPVRFPTTLIRDMGVDVELAIDADSERRLLRLEKWLSRHVIGRIPGGGGRVTEQ